MTDSDRIALRAFVAGYRACCAQANEEVDRVALTDALGEYAETIGLDLRSTHVSNLIHYILETA